MTDLPDSVGMFTVHGTHYDVFGDSDDPGDRPDIDSVVATVTFTPVRKQCGPVVSPNEATSFNLRTVHAGFNGAGILVPPADGVSGPLSKTTTGVRLVSPLSLTISDNDWFWRCTITPTRRSSGGDVFEFDFVGAPGEEYQLADLMAQSIAQRLNQLPPVWFVEVPSGDPDEVLAAAAEAGARAGHFVVNKSVSPWALYALNGD